MLTATQTTLTTEQLYAVGFGDGLAGRPRDRKYSGSLDYGMGHTQGYRSRPDSLFNVPAVQEQPLEIGAFDELLNALD
ncbi:MAG: hypothetical protein LH647_11970 [Leptolyngbyaceae cyanobacterium CAN_BIN12]|nr:hypothetical protein [Leptolyngbyaceae cyanobacterium CAN_BIN12]